jgi:hypothetical protein
MESLLFYRPVSWWIYFAVSGFVIVALSIGARQLWHLMPTSIGIDGDAFRSAVATFRSNGLTWLHLAETGLVTLMVGLVFSGSSSIPLRLTGLPPVRRLQVVWHSVKARGVRLASAITQTVGPIAEAVASEDDKPRVLRHLAFLKTWVSAVTQPVATMRRFLATFRRKNTGCKPLI